MRHRLPISFGRLFTALVALVVATTPAAAQNEDRPEPPRTSWGAPDLQGVWDYRTATPMERPRNYGDREFLTDEEAASYEQQFSQRLDDSRRSPGTVADAERAYNEFWYDFGSNLTEDKRTSLIVDPPNGRIPPLTEEARLRATGPNFLSGQPIGECFHRGVGRDIAPAHWFGRLPRRRLGAVFVALPGGKIAIVKGLVLRVFFQGLDVLGNRFGLLAF